MQRNTSRTLAKRCRVSNGKISSHSDSCELSGAAMISSGKMALKTSSISGLFLIAFAGGKVEVRPRNAGRQTSLPVLACPASQVFSSDIAIVRYRSSWICWDAARCDTHGKQCHECTQPSNPPDAVEAGMWRTIEIIMRLSLDHFPLAEIILRTTNRRSRLASQASVWRLFRFFSVSLSPSIHFRLRFSFHKIIIPIFCSFEWFSPQ